MSPDDERGVRGNYSHGPSTRNASRPADPGGGAAGRGRNEVMGDSVVLYAQYERAR